jgi:thiosulfate dehydrogenase [quinone] large subunit
MNIQKIAFLKLRFVMAFIFLWAFIDKLFGLGFATKSKDAWLNGGSPTSGFLTFGTHGPFADMFKSLAGNPLVDWLFMLGLLAVGIALLVNRYMFLAAIGGGAMMLLMWLATLPPVNNPIVDEHVVYILVLAVLAFESKKGRLDLKNVI